MIDKKYDVSSVCNALVDILFFAQDSDLTQLGLKKGVMNLVDEKKQTHIFDFFSSKERAIELGGSSLNTIKALAQLNCKTFFAGMIGNDSLGQIIKKQMDEYKIEQFLKVHEISPTGSCVVLVTPDGERTLNTCLGASSLYDPESISKTNFSNSQVFHFSGYQWDTLKQRQTAIEIIKHAKESGVTVSFDLADPWVVKKHREEFIKLIENHVDIVFANREEGRLLYGTSVEETSKKIVDSNVIAVMKLDKEGALLQDSTEQVRVRAIPTDVVDTTGAGDMFAAGFLFGYIHNKTLKTCGELASILASDVISRMGAQLSSMTVEKVLLEYK